MDKNFFNSFTKDGMGIKGLKNGIHISHKQNSNEFHITTPLKEDKLGTTKVHDFFDINGNFKMSKLRFTKDE